MSNLTSLLKGCPLPFVDAVDYPAAGGFIGGRLCTQLPGGNLSCCLPCPLATFVYSEHIDYKLHVTEWVSLVSLVACFLILISFAALPVEKSHRHYLSTGLVVTIIGVSIGFIIPLGTNPQQCHDSITPNDMSSDLSCAWTGALLVFGALGSSMWVLLRTVWMHLRVCWEKDLGRKYFIFSQVLGWAFPIVFTAVCLRSTGVSYRIGKVCLPNHPHVFATFLGWLLGIASVTILLQLATSAFSLYLYFRALKSDQGGPSTTASVGAGLPDGSMKRMTARQTWRRVQKILLLQWRIIGLCLCVIVESIYFTLVFVVQDRKTGSGKVDVAAYTPWVACLIFSGGDKEGCLKYTKGLVASESVVVASFTVLALLGIEVFLFFGRTSMIFGWRDLFVSLFRRFTKKKDNDFVSADAKELHYDPDTRTATLRGTDGRTFKSSGLPSPIMEKEEDDDSSPPNLVFAPTTGAGAGALAAGRKGDAVPAPTARKSSLSETGMPGIREKEMSEVEEESEDEEGEVQSVNKNGGLGAHPPEGSNGKNVER